MEQFAPVFNCFKHLKTTIVLYYIGEDCCGELEVEGVKYTFLESKDTSAYKCKDNCVYTKTGTQVKYCFGSGSTQSVCTGGTATTQAAAQSSTGKLDLFREVFPNQAQKIWF